MKHVKTLSFLLFFFLLSTQIFGQIPIVDEDLRWNMIWSENGPPYSYTIKFEGDTTFNNQVYKEIFFSYDSLNVDWFTTGNYIREDSLQRVFVDNDGPESGTERLLFDFSVALGDTIHWLGYDECSVVVEDIQFVDYPDGTERKTIVLNYPEIITGEILSTEWVEGLGNTSVGPINPGPAICSTDNASWLLCAYDNGELFYDGGGATCFLVDVEEILEVEGVKVYPNPTNGKLQLEVIAPGLSIERVVLYNAVGQPVLAELNEERIEELDITALPEGVYHLKVLFDSGQFSLVKVLKTK